MSINLILNSEETEEKRWWMSFLQRSVKLYSHVEKKKKEEKVYDMRKFKNNDFRKKKVLKMENCVRTQRLARL